MQASPVKDFARGRAIALAQPRSLRLDGPFAEDAALARQAITAAQADVMVVAAYGLILPKWVLDLMCHTHPGAGPGPGGCLNIHASLLPRWRGAAPIHRAIEAGDATTGVTIMRMDEGLDTGDILLAQEMPIVQTGASPDTAGTLHDRLAALGADLIVRALEQAALGQLRAQGQGTAGVSQARKVDKSQARVNWGNSALQIERGVRAFNPAPGAWTELDGVVLKLWRTQVSGACTGNASACGTILGADDAGIDVACGRGVLRLRELQRAGGKRLGVADFLRGFAVQEGMQFDRELKP